VSASSEPTELILFCLIGGPCALFWGIRRLQLRRLIENTPSSKIRSAAMGLVELSGMARAVTVTKAPVSNLDACWWRCRVQEYRKQGKNHSWVTIKEVSSETPFWVEDDTGKLLVMPMRAEIDARCVTTDLRFGAGDHAALLTQWGIDATGFFGTSRNLRICEEAIHEFSPLYVLGELTKPSHSGPSTADRLHARLRAAKADPATMKAIDANQDGTVDAQEWDRFRDAQAAVVGQQSLSGNKDEMLVVQAPREGAFLISVRSEKEIVKRFGWFAPLAIGAGVIGTGFGAWLALTLQWSPVGIVAVIAAGIGIGFVVSLKGESKWRWYFS
jgi:hypothetical protein